MTTLLDRRCDPLTRNDVRKQAGLTQRQLADLVGTTRSPLAQPATVLPECIRALVWQVAELSIIAQLEDADYDGHSLSMLALSLTWD
jgi:hypothetical protein